MSSPRGADEILAILELNDYEEQALHALLELGRTTAPDLADATGIPKARIYGVLDTLADHGYIKIIPGRPKEYDPKPPGQILDRYIENQRQDYQSAKQHIEKHREDFLAAFQPLYDQRGTEVSPTEELFHVVDVGTPSERETRTLYHDATDCIHILTKSFEYFDDIEPAFQDALDRDCELNIIFLDPALLEPENRDIQETLVTRIRESYPDIETRFSASRLPWRGTIIDPSMDYDSGQAIILVEEKDIPLHKRQAAVTENESFVAGLERYFQLTWNHDTLTDDPYRD